MLNERRRAGEAEGLLLVEPTMPKDKPNRRKGAPGDAGRTPPKRAAGKKTFKPALPKAGKAKPLRNPARTEARRAAAEAAGKEGAPKKEAPKKFVPKKAVAGEKAPKPRPKAANREALPREETPAPPPPEPKPAVDPATAFGELGLDPEIVRAVLDLGFESPTPIQARAIPVLLQGGDLIGQAQTGTGKTAAFALPIVQRADPAQGRVQALVLVPTRELAVQVAGGIYDLAKHTGLRVVAVYGGQPIDRQFRALKNGPQIVVGTPGRVLDHLRRGSISLAHVIHCTLDEADEMLALGFAEDLEAILSELPETRQMAFFSATMPPKAVHLTKKFLRDPQHVSIETRRRTLETTNQVYYEVPRGKKLEALARVLDMETPGPTIVFCRTRQETSDLSDALRLRGYNTEALHGEMNQPERDRVMRRFRDGHADLLVATDVAARGLDIETVTHVINYDIPWDVEQYIHRIGRTGRAGRTGDAITLVEGKQRRMLEVIERVIGTKIRPARIPSAADIAARRREQFQEALRGTLEDRQFDGHLAAVEELQETYDPAEIAAAALHMLWQSQHAAPPAQEEIDADFEQPEAGMTRIFLGLGRNDGLRPADVVGAITGETNLPGKAIGVIDVLDSVTFVEVPSDHADRVVEALGNAKMRNKRVKVSLARSR
jgi:ATP-dependent RNA helicase DeaD